MSLFGFLIAFLAFFILVIPMIMGILGIDGHLHFNWPVLTDGKDEFLYVRWNSYCVNGMTGLKNDVWVKRIERRFWGFYKNASGEFNDESGRYHIVEGENAGMGIRPDESIYD